MGSYSMDHLEINTSQNVVIEHDVASIGDRMLAQLIDYCVFFGYFLIVVLLDTLLLGNITFVNILLCLPVLFYDLFFEYFYNGQNLGKKVARIKVIRMDGAPATFGNYLIRWLFRIVDNVLVWGAVSVITIIINGKGQRLGDIAAGTTVIRLTKKSKLATPVFVNIPDDYKPVYPTAQYLTEKEIEIINDVLQYYRKNKYFNNPQYGDRTRDALEKKMKIKPQQFTLDFFQTILMDYNYFNK